MTRSTHPMTYMAGFQVSVPGTLTSMTGFFDGATP